jgi:excisionase family DNA binding protein
MKYRQTAKQRAAYEAAKLLRVCNRTVYRLVNQGKLPGARVGDSWRFSRDVLLKFLEKGAI